jgi:type IV pilus assembly protein PilF
MRLTEAVRDRIHSWLFCACLALVALAGLSGCASNPGSAGGSGKDLVTDSDEPEARKRARIRLELAVGYFEQGQTTVALDEIKQALIADPNFADAYNVRGLVYMRLNDLGLAEESFRRAMALNPGDANLQHNYGWLLCQQARYPEAVKAFAQALANPNYGGRAKTWMTQGLCQARAGQRTEAEYSFSRSLELDAGNPVTSYNLALLLFQRGDFVRAQFYIRRLNNSQLANSESLWLGIKVERRVGNRIAADQLAGQLKNRYPKSREAELFERGAFNE